jgi:hypothetical protein
MADRWSAMLEKFVAYRKRFGTADVSSRDSEHARLGRWVAAQRHKNLKGLLSAVRAQKLTAAGMIWSPGETGWAKKFDQLKKFARREGHCNIPEHYPPNQSLASWAHNQRYRKRRNELSAERAEKLASIGFLWAIYLEKKKRRKRPAMKKRFAIPPSAAEDALVLPDARSRRMPEERLYRLRQGSYVQFSGKGSMPEQLVRIEKLNKELPPYIPLPRFETTFRIGDETDYASFSWPGKGPLPREVMDYVNENDCLPPRT